MTTNIVIAALSCAAAIAGKPSKSLPRVDIVANAEAANSVVLDEAFGIVGQGFHPALPARVCISGDECWESDVNEDGGFEQDRTLHKAGVATVYVFQPRSRRELALDNWEIRATKTFNVIE